MVGRLRYTDHAGAHVRLPGTSPSALGASAQGTRQTRGAANCTGRGFVPQALTGILEVIMGHRLVRRAAVRLLLALAALAVVPLLAMSAPRVIRTVPENGDRNVDPGLGEIRVVFDSDMRADGYSFVGGGPGFPKPTGQPRWLDRRTCALPVQLEPDHDYSFSINSERFTKFQGTDGVPAVPMPVTFHTAGRRDAVELTLEQVRAAISELRRAIDQHYSYRDRRGLDWDDLFLKSRSSLEQARTPAALAAAAANVLRAAEDVHIWLEAGGKIVPTFQRDVRPDFDLAMIRTEVPDFEQVSRAAFSGRFADGTGYVLLGSLDRGRVPIEKLDVVLRRFQDAPALILDLRANGGGDEGLAREIAGCFVDQPVTYARHVLRAPDLPSGFSEPIDRVLTPAREGRPRFRGKVAVLQGRFTLSSAEALVLMMKQVPRCITLGDTTYGSSGNPKPHDLGGGVTLYLPSWKNMDAKGQELEGRGIAPDVFVGVDPASLRDGDPILAAVRKSLTAGMGSYR